MLLRALEVLARRGPRLRPHPAWSAVTLAAFLLRAYQRQAARDTVVLREELKPGESLLITHTSQPQG